MACVANSRWNQLEGGGGRRLGGSLNPQPYWMLLEDCAACRMRSKTAIAQQPFRQQRRALIIFNANIIIYVAFPLVVTPPALPHDCPPNLIRIQLTSKLMYQSYYIQFIRCSMGNCENSDSFSEVHVPTLGRLGAVLDLKVANYVWQKDYQGLYDYDSRQVSKQIYSIKANSLVLYDKEHKIIKEVSEDDFHQETLKKAAFQVIRKANYYKILPIYIDNQQYTLQKLLWLVVKTVPTHRYPIKERDIIKFGKQKIKVREIVLNDANPSLVEFASIKTEKKIYDDLKLKPEVANSPKEREKEDLIQEIQSVVTENQQTCRICLEPGELSNPLICPCKCTGSVRYIHLQCLRTWLGKRLNVIRSKFCISIKWTPLTCEMCKTHYRYRIYLDNKKYYTVEIPKPGKPYIVLEVMKKNAQFSKIFHFVSLAQTSKVSIGRKKDIDVKISDDISVSRHHANIIYDFENRRFLLEDNKSKFGTLVLVKKNLIISPLVRGLAFQMGGEIFAFDTQRGEGSIPDYYDEEQYLNVTQRGDKQAVEEDSEEENNEQFEDEEQEEDAVPTHANLNNLHPPQPIEGASSMILVPPSQNLIMNSPVLPGHQSSVVEILDS